MMKKLVLLLTLPIFFLPLTSCGTKIPKESLSFIVSYKKGKGDVAEKVAYLVRDDQKITEKSFKVDLTKIETIKYYSSTNSELFGKTVKGTQLIVGDLLTIRLSEALDINKLSTKKIVANFLSASASNGGRSQGKIVGKTVHYGDEIAYGDYDFEELPLVVYEDKVIDPNTLEEGRIGYGGYYKYGTNKKNRLVLPFVVEPLEETEQ